MYVFLIIILHRNKSAHGIILVISIANLAYLVFVFAILATNLSLSRKIIEEIRMNYSHKPIFDI